MAEDVILPPSSRQALRARRKKKVREGAEEKGETAAVTNTAPTYLGVWKRHLGDQCHLPESIKLKPNIVSFHLVGAFAPEVSTRQVSSTAGTK